jgi:putative transposon-encoded protein
MKPIEVKMEGYEVIEKRAQRSGTSARIYVPKSWTGKLVRAILIEK